MLSGHAGGAPASVSASELEALEAVQRFLDQSSPLRTSALAEPGPFPDEQLLPLAVGLEVEHRRDIVVDQNRLREIAEYALLLRNIGLEAMFVAEEQREPPTLDHQRVERIEDVDDVLGTIERHIQHRGRRPVLVPAAVERNRHQLLAPRARADQLADRDLARRIEVTDRVEAH